MDLKKKKIPDSPGVYFFLNKKGGILYIGKATSLKDRVKSYFLEARSPLIAKMIEEATDVKWQKTDSVLEALILESRLIKKHKPRYNTKEKDNKSFNYVVITKEDFPKVLVIREQELLQKDIDIKYQFGPFPSGNSLKTALSIIRKIFPFQDRNSAVRGTFYKQLGLSPDTSEKDAQKQYQRNIRNLKLFFDGKKGELRKKLQREMQEHAKKEEFELAEKKKRQLFALDHIQDVALIGNKKSTGGFRIESYDIAHTSGENVVGVMVVFDGGEPAKGEYRKFNVSDGINDTKALSEVLDRRLGHSEWELPKLIVVDGGRAQKNTMEKILKNYGLSIPVVAVVKDERHRARNILASKDILSKYESQIIQSNAEAHRFAITFHRKKRGFK